MTDLDEKVVNYIIDYIGHNNIVYSHDMIGMKEIWKIPYENLEIEIITSYLYQLILCITLKSKNKSVVIQATSDRQKRIGAGLFYHFDRINKQNRDLQEKKRLDDLAELLG